MDDDTEGNGPERRHAVLEGFGTMDDAGRIAALQHVLDELQRELDDIGK